ncbi:Fc.00g020970.m01.CDS01 [Cosmosporella sp. VM-42]
MTDQHAPSRSLGVYTRRDRAVTPEGRSRFSYDIAERGEPSTIGELLSAPTSPDRPLAFSDDELLPRFNIKPRERGSRQGHRERRTRRTHKPQSSGGFLLQDAVAGDDEFGQQRRQPRYTAQSKGKDLLDPLSSSLPRNVGLGIGSSGGLRPRIVSPDTSQEDLMVRKRDGVTRGGSKQHQGSSTLDVDSTQIVNMALNLSESRRIASRRNMARTNPPRLAPIQDPAPGSNLKAHLQQQRKTSRAISPRPNQSLTPRLSGVRSSSPLRPAFEPGHDSPYRYHFSTSTLARAQKARQHLELMAQYRLLLELLPPLKRRYDRNSASSPPSSPVDGKMTKWVTSGSGTPLGREYNPLQYIRNRKVRARERKAIDGGKQGFSDVDSVKLWVARALERASTTDLLIEGCSTLPPFLGAEEAEAHTTPESAPKAALRVRRPRVDWFFEPCDMVADAYWLEQDHHKQLIEDRNWCKIFPQATDLSRPMSRQTDELMTGVTPFATKTYEDAEGRDSKEFKLIRPDTDNSQGSSHRDRAKQKLHDIGGGFHRHTPSSHTHHDFLRRKDSDSSLSGSDNETKHEGKSRRTRHTRAGTLSSHTNDLLQKQMLDMIAKEAKEQQLSQVLEDPPEQAISITPERPMPSNPSSHGRGSVVTDPSESGSVERTQIDFSRYQLNKPEMGASPRRRQESADIDSPQPMSPELTAQDNLYPQPTGLDLSAPSSRSSSPSRNPFSKVKQIFRDKTREDAEAQLDEGEDTDQRPSIPSAPLSPVQSRTFPEDRATNSRPAYESHKYNRSTNSARLRGDEQIGLRGMFKGPRIDTVIRGGVSRLGDMLWKKDNSTENAADAFSTDESDNEQGKRGARLSLTLSRTDSRRVKKEPQQKHFLDTMPQFQHVADVQNKSAGTKNQTLGSELVKSQSQPLAHFDALKPPKPDMSAQSGTSTPAIKQSRYADVEISESESVQDIIPDATKAKDNGHDSISVMPGFDQKRRAPSRHWSITDRASPEGTQLSRREVARLRALILASGIKAMEISRRAQEPTKPLVDGSLQEPGPSAKSNVAGVPWPEIAQLAPKDALPSDDMVPYSDHFTLASQTLGVAIQTSYQQWQVSADRFTNQTRPHLEKRIWRVRSRIADDLSGMTGEAADQADETGKDLALGQRLKVKHVIDIIEKMSRNRRRRFRWVRRGMWLAVEWVLVGFMWYVWFIVMIFRIVLGVGQGVWRGVKWLLWL